LDQPTSNAVQNTAAEVVFTESEGQKFYIVWETQYNG